MESCGGQTEKPGWDASLNVDILEPLNDSSLSILSRFEMVAIDGHVCTNHCIFVLWESVIFIVTESVRIFSFLRVIRLLLHLHQAVSLRNER